MPAAKPGGPEGRRQARATGPPSTAGDPAARPAAGQRSPWPNGRTTNPFGDIEIRTASRALPAASTRATRSCLRWAHGWLAQSPEGDDAAAAAVHGARAVQHQGL